MKANINEVVDAVFKGIIMVLASSGVTLFWLLTHPRRALPQIERRMRNSRVEQVTPHVLLVLTISALFLCPLFLNNAVLPAILAGRDPVNVPLAVLRSAFDSSYSRLVFAVAVGSVVGTAVTHFIWYWMAVGIKQRRQKLINTMMLIQSVQSFLLMLGLIFAICSFVALVALFEQYGLTQLYTVSMTILVACGLIILVIFLYPVRLVGIVARRSSQRFKFNRTVLAIGIFAVTALSLPLSLAVAGAVAFGMSPATPLAKITTQSCELGYAETVPTIWVAGTLSNPSPEAVVRYPGQFSVQILGDPSFDFQRDYKAKVVEGIPPVVDRADQHRALFVRPGGVELVSLRFTPTSEQLRDMKLAPGDNRCSLRIKDLEDDGAPIMSEQASQ